VRKQIEQPLRTTSGVKNINSKEIANLLLPLPSFLEQRRIVAEIDKLMVLCDNLEKQIDSANSKQTDLLNAVITKI
jgi:type I restriction enzyme S subunit